MTIAAWVFGSVIAIATLVFTRMQAQGWRF